MHDRRAEHGPAVQRQGQRLSPGARPGRRREVCEALPDRTGQCAGREAAANDLAVEQACLVQQVALLGVIPDHVETAVPDGRLPGRPGHGLGHQPVRAGIDLAGRLTGARQRDFARQGLLADHSAPQQHAGVLGVRVLRVDRGAYRAAGAIGLDATGRSRWTGRPGSPGHDTAQRAGNR